MEHYLFNGSKKNLFDSSSDAAIRKWLQSQQSKVKEWITKSKPTYGLTNAALASDFKLTCQITEECGSCGGYGSAIAGCCKGRDGMTEEQKANLPFGCPKELRCDECTCKACRGEGVVAIDHADCPTDENGDRSCKVHCTDCEGYCTVSAEESDESREECATCNGDGKYRKPKAEPEKPKCVECLTTLPEPLDGKPPRYCTRCRAEQPPPPRTECSNADCTITFNGPTPNFCNEGHPQCKLCWGKCVQCDCGAICKEHAHKQCPGCSTCKRMRSRKTQCVKCDQPGCGGPCKILCYEKHQLLYSQSVPSCTGNVTSGVTRRRIAEDTVQPFPEQWPLAAFLKERHAARVKRDAIQRGQRIPHM